MFGILFVLVFSVLCSMLLVAESTGTNLGQRLGRREVPAGDSSIAEAERQISSGGSVSTLETSTGNDRGLEGVDLLGGFTGFETHFYVAQVSNLAARPSLFPTPSISVMDPFKALSDAFREAMEAVQHDVATSTSPDLLPIKKEAGQNNKSTMDSILWQGNPSLLHMVSDIAGQVCVVDPGAGARFIDTIVNTLSLDSVEIASIISNVAQYSSSSAADMLPLLLPAIAAALGEHIEPSPVSTAQTIDDTMSEVLWKGNIFLTTIITSNVYLDNSDLHGLLDQVAGLMCAAASRLKLPICMVSTNIASHLYQLVIPCNCINSKSGASPSQPLQSHSNVEATSSFDWNVTTVLPTAGYTFQSFSDSKVPSVYEQRRTSNFPVTTLRDRVSAPAIQPYTELAQPQTSYSPCPPPAYSVTTETEVPAPSACTELPVMSSSSGVCSCQDSHPMGYGSNDNFKPIKVGSKIPESYEYNANTVTTIQSSATQCHSEPATPTMGLTLTVGNPPHYANPVELPSKQPMEYNQKSQMPGYPLVEDDIGWRYLGCFGDAPERTLQGGGPENSFTGKVSNRNCIDYCGLKEYEFAGTEDGQECWCGKSMANNVRRLPDTACSTFCQGESADYCGGAWAISVYKREKKELEQPKKKYSSLAELLSLSK
ncbi:hypothetical protein NQ176_g6941 [Zarea fungicola]|uniref:Uncharacterized protein n=1 Tax=Zarea fungicola TaxID=93591 RepID=A0ACC1N0N4_9HYPO|nr:hypothetical protein NQ176_g6941 [Lecanicillium fungicola]